MAKKTREHLIFVKTLFFFLAQSSSILLFPPAKQLAHLRAAVPQNFNSLILAKIGCSQEDSFCQRREFQSDVPIVELYNTGVQL